LRLGAYEIEVRLTEDAIAHAGGSVESSPFGDPFAMDPFGPARPQRNPFDEPNRPSLGMPQTGAQLPHDFDPLMGPESHESPFQGPTQADHSPSMQDAFRAPAQVGQVPLHSGGIIPGDDLLPDDWDKDLLEGISPGAGAVAPPPAPIAPAPVSRVEPPPVVHEPPPQPAAEPEVVSPFDEPAAHEPPPVVAPPPQPPPVAVRRVPQAPPEPERQTLADDSALLAAFLEGAGMQDAQPKDPAATMLALGKAFRNLVAGLRAVMIARASIKSEFRIEQTMIQARGNNPLKFSAGDDDALAALLGTGRRTDMAPHDAVADALRDIRLHELASMAAMQAAVRSLLEGLDPAKLRAAAEQGGGMTLLPAQKKARAWDAYEALFTKTVQALADDFDSVFGKAFARAYERSLQDVSAKER
jgi:type VI secretion system FHA domain protein